MPQDAPARLQAPLSIRAYARHRQVSAPSVLRAIRAGRLKASLVVDAKGNSKIADVALADREWTANTDLSRAPGSVKERADTPKVLRPTTVTPPTVTAPAGVSSLTEASAREKHWKAKQAELDYLQAAGELVEVAPIAQRLTDLITQCKTKLLSVPSKAKHALPHLTRADVRVIDDLIRQALEDLAQSPVVSPDRPDA